MRSITLMLGSLGLSLALVGCGNEEKEFADSKGNKRKQLSEQEEADLNSAIVKEFHAGTILDEDISVATGFGLVEQKFKLRLNVPTQQINHQINRPQHDENHVQGHPGDKNDEEFKVREEGLLDILIVMDDSQSMENIQNGIATKIAPLLSHIGNANWQIAVTTTSSSCLRVAPSGKRVISKKDFKSNPIQAAQDFADLIKAGIGGKNKERGVLMATHALLGECLTISSTSEDIEIKPEVEWLREDAATSVILITDEKNCGSASNEGCPSKDYKDADYFFNKISKPVTVHGLLLLYYDSNLCSNGGYADEDPVQYKELINKTGGITDHVCQSDYTGVLENISKNIGDRIVPAFELAFEPVTSTVQVTLDSEVLSSSDYSLTGKILKITKPIDLSSELVTVSYEHGAKPKFDKVALSEKAADDSIRVTVNGEIFSRSQFQYDSTNQVLKFLTIPEDKAQVDISYREDVPLKSTFTLNEEFLEETLVVKVRDVEVENYTIDLPNKKVHFTEIPSDGVEINFTYNTPNDRIRSYPISGVKVSKIEDYKILDESTGDEISTHISSDHIVFDNVDDIIKDRPIIAQYDIFHTEDELKFSIPISHDPLNEEFTILADNDPDVCRSNLDYSSRTVRFECLHDNMANINLRYSYVADYTNNFEVSGPFLERKTCSVFVEGKPYTDYSQKNFVFTIPEEDLPPGSRVKVICEYDPEEETIED